MSSLLHLGACLFLAMSGVAHAQAGEGIITTPAAPAAIGPYSQGIDTGNMVFVSGQLGLTPAGDMAGPQSVDQARQALDNIKAILARAGLTMDDVAQTQIYVVDLSEFAQINAVYATYFHRPPARATVQVAALPRGGRVEIAAIAVRQAVARTAMPRKAKRP